jgi:hypothetical protein
MQGKNRSRRGTGHLYQKDDRWYGQWYVRGKRTKRSLGPVRQAGASDGLTRRQAQARMLEAMAATDSPPAPVTERLTVEEVALDLGGGDAFTEMVAGRVIEALEENATCTREQLVTPAHEAAQWGWCDPDGGPPSVQGVSWVVGDVLRRAEAYGLIDHTPDPADPKSWRTLISLNPAGRLVVGRGRSDVVGRAVYVFDYGDEWRVMLTLRERIEGSSAIPRVSDRRGTAPPQYPPLEEEEPWPES